MVDGSVDRRRFLQRAGMAVALPALGGCAKGAPAALAHSSPASPDDLFKDGEFVEAERRYRTLLRGDPSNAHAAAQIGYIALLSNRFSDAERYLTRAVRLAPRDLFSLRQLADCFIRQDLFARALPALRATGDANDAATAEQLARVSGPPWQVHGPSSTRVPLLTLDPLPQVEISVNGTPARKVIVDTGATTLDCSMELAHQAGLHVISTRTAILGGRPTTINLGIAESVRLGSLEVRNIPVQWHDAPPLGDTQGTIGTTFFYHFLTTIDYANRQLILRERTQRPLHSRALPLWLAGDHIPVTLGRLNDYGPRLVTLDTGGIGRGLDTSVEIARRARIAVDLTHPVAGPGPAQYPISPARISLGNAIGRHISGLAQQNPPDNGLKFDTIANFTNLYFRPFTVTFDFVQMKLTLQHPNNKP